MTLVPLEEARAFVLDRCLPIAPQPIALSQALGAVVAEPVTCTESVPPFDNTAVDGFAVRAADVAAASPEHPAQLSVVDTVLAGQAPTVAVGEGEAVRIMTGAPIPPGADAVVMVEHTEPAGADGVAVSQGVEAGQHVRPAGDDLRPGDVVVEPGALIGPALVGLLATVGRDPVVARRRPRVGVMSTGDELVSDGAALAPGQIRDSNRPMLLAQVAAGGFDPVDLGCIPDDRAAIATAIGDGVARCDALVSSGGVSMGDVDLVKVVLDELGDMRWMQVAIKPAKPLAFGTIDSGERAVPVFGLPGNPVSSAVSFELFARPGLRALAGCTELHRPVVRATAAEALRRRADGKVHFVRVRLEPGPEGLRVRSAGAQGSHQLSALARADGLAVLPDGDGVAEGEPVEVMVLW